MVLLLLLFFLLPIIIISYGYSVRYRSANQANSAFHPYGVGEWVVIHVWIMGVETLNGRAVLRMAVRRMSMSRGRGLSLRPIGCTPAPSVTYSRSCRLWRYISVMPLPLLFTRTHNHSIYIVWYYATTIGVYVCVCVCADLRSVAAIRIADSDLV